MCDAARIDDSGVPAGGRLCRMKPLKACAALIREADIGAAAERAKAAVAPLLAFYREHYNAAACLLPDDELVARVKAADSRIATVALVARDGAARVAVLLLPLLLLQRRPRAHQSPLLRR